MNKRDIVERLRDNSGRHINGLYDEEAADEIERLRTALVSTAEPGVREDGMPRSKVERELRRMLCIYQAGARAYMDDGEAADAMTGIDYMRMTPDQIKALIYKHNLHIPSTRSEFDLNTAVSRFLAWPLPKTFMPDCGVSFTKPNHPTSWPVGTNLFTADEAKAMLEHVLGVTSGESNAS